MSSIQVLHKLNAILETSKLLNATRDVDYILRALLDKSLELIEGGDTGAIFLYNKESGLLEVEAYAGFNAAIKRVKLKPGESMTGTAFLREEAMFYKEPTMASATMSEMDPLNYQNLEESSPKGLQTLHGSIACPLIYQKSCLGAIVIDNFDNHAPLIDEDVLILEAISVQATIAIMNAQNYRKEIENNKKLESYNKLLEEERNKYKYSTGLHTKFTDMMLEGCSLEDIINELANLIHHDVLLIDLFFKVKSSAIKFTSLKDIRANLLQDIKRDLMISSTKMVYAPMISKYIHYFPILVNGEVLGWIVTLSSDDYVSEIDHMTIEKASTILALEMMKADELSDMEQDFKGDFLDALMLNHDFTYLNKCAEDFNFNFNHEHVISIISSKPVPLNEQNDQYRKRHKRYLQQYYQLINSQMQVDFPGSIALIKDQELVVIIELPEFYARKDIISSFESFLSEADQILNKKSKMTPLFIGVSQIIRNIEFFGQAFHNAHHTLKTLMALGNNERYLFFSDLEVKQLLLNNDSETLDYFLNETLGSLLNYDKKSKDEFLETLSVYIKSNGNWTHTKDYLHIHGNTLNYRLSRIMSILNLDLNDYKQRLKLQIAFEILEIQRLNYN